MQGRVSKVRRAEAFFFFFRLQLVADVERLCQELDQAKFDRDIGVGSKLRETRAIRQFSSSSALVFHTRRGGDQAHVNLRLRSSRGDNGQVLTRFGRVRRDFDRIDLERVRGRT